MIKIIVSFFILFLSPKLTFSALGEKESTVNNEQKNFLTKTYTIKTHNLYSVHELTREGLTLREFISQDGVIFGLAWQGIAHPDLSKLLGKRTQDYHRALKSKTPTNRQKFSAINGNDIVVEKAGQMRSVRGRAYIPSLLPLGMNADEIK